MYHLYIVDDEPHVIEGMKKCINWEQHGIRIIGCAADGSTACKEILTLMPDVVLTDIKMPVMDGISLINEVHSQLPHINFIIFSGYSDFHYAREALLANAVDFLVKPASTDEILHAITRAVNRQAHRAETLQSAKIYYNSPNYRKLLKGIFMNPVSGIYSEGCYYIAIIGTIEVSTISVLQKELDICLEDQKLHASFITLFDSRLAVIYSETSLTHSEWQVLLRHLMNNLNIYFTMDNDFVFLGISNPNKLHNLKSGYQEALKATEYCRWFSAPYCLYGDISYTDLPLQQLPFWNELKVCMRRNDLPQILLLLGRQFESFHEEHISPSSLKEFCLKAYLMLRNDTLGDYSIDPILEISSLSSLKDSYLYLTAIYRNYFETASLSHTGNQSKFIQKITLYIQAHYQEPISLNSAADYTNKSAGYISNRFKKEVGVSFPQYVTDYRLLKAKQLLITSNLKIKDIALMAGFSDEQYFSLVFKKECGITAGMYRKIYQEST